MEDLIKALQIFLKYNNSRNPSHCVHDYFYINVNPKLVSEKDIIELGKLGFFIDSEYGSIGFGSFRYGSC